jgi:hypothetical protein
MLIVLPPYSRIRQGVQGNHSRTNEIAASMLEA